MVNRHALLIVAVASVITLLLRAFPFLVFGGKRQVPKFVLYLGKTVLEALPPRCV